MVSVKTFQTGDHISIVEGSDTVVAHGVMLDDEPDVDEIFREQEMVHEASRVPSHWCTVAITDVVRGCGKVEIDSGHVFHTSGVYLDAAERTISALHEEYPEHAASYLQSRIRRLAGRQFAISVAHQTADVPLVRVKPDGRTTVSLTVCVHNQTSDQQW